MLRSWIEQLGTRTNKGRPGPDRSGESAVHASREEQRVAGFTLGILGLLVLAVCAASASAADFTVTAPNLTTHAGDPLPPLIFRISSYQGAYASHFSGEPALSTTATANSPAGIYPITISAGNFRTVDPADQVNFVGGHLTVLPQDAIGAHLTNHVAYPPHFMNGPSPYRVVDVTHNPTATLVGDCVTDNARAFSLLLSQNGSRNAGTTNGGGMPLYLYFPPGCYATSQPLTIYGNTWTLWGSGPQTSVIRLLPNSPAFNTGAPVQFFSPQSVKGNQNFREYIYNLGFSIGPGNPDAIALTSIQNNIGAVRNVQIWADDSNCPAGVSLSRAYPGPVLFHDVAVYGCKTAFSSNQNEYSATLEGITTEGQSGAAFNIGSMKISVRHWLSDNQVQALHVYGSNASLAILDSALLDGSPNETAITVDKGASAYIGGLASSGYGVTEIDDGTGTAVRRTGNIAQAWTGTASTLFNEQDRPDSLHVSVQETPRQIEVDPSGWIALSDDAANWPSQVSHARAATLYAAPGVYHASGTIRITVPDTVDHLQFYQAKFETSAPQLVLLVAGSSPRPLVIDGCPYGSCQIVHTGTRALVIRDAALRSYTSRDGAGDVYVEDAILSSGSPDQTPVRFFASQSIWARQLNLEQSGVNKLECSGCRLWILGYKTEQASPSLVLTDGAQAEIFGFFFYQNRPPGDVAANISITDSSLFATGWTKVDVAGYGQRSWIIERRGSRTAALPTADANSSQRMNAFYSFGAGKTPEGQHR